MAKKGAGGEPVAAVEELPRSIVRRIVKDKLEQLASSSSKAKGNGGEGDENGVIVNKESLLAFSESARIFIHYLSATANDICKESKRQTINAEDVFKALEEIEFPEFVGPLRASLEDYRKKNAAKKFATKGKEANKKRKMEEETQNGEVAVEDEGDAEEVAADAEANGDDSDK